MARSFRDDYIGLFDRHVAINAFVHNLVSPRLRHCTALPLMASEALQRIGVGGLSGRVDVVAGRAAHLWRRTIAFASLKQSDLVAMDIGMFHIA